jgi:hypothetical protein
VEEADEREEVEEDVFELEEQAQQLQLDGGDPDTGSAGTLSHRDGFEGTFTRHPQQNAGAARLLLVLVFSLWGCTALTRGTLWSGGLTGEGERGS